MTCNVQFLVLQMLGAVTPETCSDFAVNNYVHSIAPSWIFINIFFTMDSWALMFYVLALLATTLLGCKTEVRSS